MNVIMKKILFVLTLMVASFVSYASSTNNMEQPTSVYELEMSADVIVGDYTAFTAGQNSRMLEFSVYNYPNACNSYYALIGGKKYAVRDNPDYDPEYKYTGPTANMYRSTHYVQYGGDKYYFSL